MALVIADRYNFSMQSIITITLYLLSILVPLIFTTINFELFEFPKFIFLLAGSLVITISWAIHVYITKDYTLFKKDPPFHIKIMHWSVLAILITQTIATIFAIHPYTSFWGYYSRFHGGLLTTICYTIIYFSATKWLDTKSTQKMIKISVGTAIIVSLYAIAEHFGIDKNFWIQDVQSRPFATLGQPNWLAAYLIPNFFLVLYIWQTQKNKTPVTTLFHYLTFILFLTALIFTKSRSGFIAFSLSFITYWLLLVRQFSFTKIKKSLTTYSILFLLPIFIFGSPYTPSLTSMFAEKPVEVAPVPQGTALENGGTESGDIRKIVWTGAIKLITKHPIVGTGPETFAYTYYWERPVAHNMTSEWDFLYNKAHNEYLNIAANTGLLGLLAYLSWHLAMIIICLNKIPRTKKVSQDKEDNIRSFYPVLGASVVAFTITNFFGFSVVPVYLLMTLIASFSATIKKEQFVESCVVPRVLYFLLPLAILYPMKIFLADLSYAKGKRYFDANQLAVALPLLQKAVESRPKLDLYHSTLGEAYATLGQTDKALSELAINKKLNPYHLNFYKSRAKIYLTLASLQPSYNVQAADELTKARTLAPTDPKLAYNLGLIYTRLSAADKAEEQLLEAITLKPNYAEPYYAITLLYEQTKQVAKIKPILEGAKSNLATYSGQLKEKIDKYTDQ